MASRTYLTEGAQARPLAIAGPWSMSTPLGLTISTAEHIALLRPSAHTNRAFGIATKVAAFDRPAALLAIKRNAKFVVFHTTLGRHASGAQRNYEPAYAVTR